MYNITKAVSPAAANVATDVLLKKGSGVFVWTDFVEWNRDDVSLTYVAMPQKKGRGKISGLPDFYAVLIISLSGKGTGNDRYPVKGKEPVLPCIIRLTRGVIHLGAKAHGQLVKQNRGLFHSNSLSFKILRPFPRCMKNGQYLNLVLF